MCFMQNNGDIYSLLYAMTVAIIKQKNVDYADL